MTEPEKLDQHLAALFARLDTRPDFNARLLARLHVEAQKDALAAANRARREEEARYRAARRELRTTRHWKNVLGRLLSGECFGVSTLELAGGAALGIGAVASILR
jgi:hypothetical protein